MYLPYLYLPVLLKHCDLQNLHHGFLSLQNNAQGTRSDGRSEIWKPWNKKKQQLVGGLKHISQMFNMFSKVEPGKMLGTRTIEKKHLFELQVRPTPKGRSFTHRPPFKFSVAENLVSNLGSSCRGHLFDTKPCNNALWRIRSPPKNMHTFA